MSSLGWEIPTLFDVIVAISFTVIPILLLVSILVKLVLKHFIKQKYQANLMSSTLTISIGVIGIFILGGFFSTDILIYSIPLLVLAVIIFIFLQGVDKLLTLHRKTKLVIIFIIVGLFVFLYPKKIYKTYQGSDYLDTTSCRCIGFNTKPGNLTSQYNSCLGIPISCKTRRDYCKDT